MGGYNETYSKEHTRLFCQKLGLTKSEDGDKELIELLLKAFYASNADFNQSFRDMSETNIEDWSNCKNSCSSGNWGLLKLGSTKRFKEFVKMYETRLMKEESSEEKRMDLMQKMNPKYVLRNWMAQSAIEKAEKDDFSEVEILHKVLSQPFKSHPEADALGYTKPPPGWSKDLVVSCSS